MVALKILYVILIASVKPTAAPGQRRLRGLLSESLTGDILDQ
jgi:hypothetical protein